MQWWLLYYPFIPIFGMCQIAPMSETSNQSMLIDCPFWRISPTFAFGKEVHRLTGRTPKCRDILRIWLVFISYSISRLLRLVVALQPMFALQRILLARRLVVAVQRVLATLHLVGDIVARLQHRATISAQVIDFHGSQTLEMFVWVNMVSGHTFYVEDPKGWIAKVILKK